MHVISFSNMSMIGLLARSGVESCCVAASSTRPSQLRTIWAPLSSLAFRSCYRRGAAFPESSKFTGVGISLRFSSLSQYQLRSPSKLQVRYGSPESEFETEEKSRQRKSALLYHIFKVLGVAIIAFSFVILRAKILAKKPLLLRSRLRIERLIAGDISALDSREISVRDLSQSNSKSVNGKEVFVSNTADTRLQEALITGERKGSERRAFGGSSMVCTSVNLAEDQDLLGVNEEAFEQWLVELKDAAVKKGIRESVVVQALQGIRPSQRIMELDSNQPEVKLTLEAYLKNMINAYRVNKGISGFLENELLLAEISSKYGIPSPVLVAIWGIESSYGGYTGNWDILRALVTLAYASKEPRRAQFFRGEILQALQIIQDGHGPQNGEKLSGSWAGAMGQCQFMPSSFQMYAVDYDGDGRKDIWESRADMFASMANYLKEHGWQRGGLVAQKVQIPDNIDKNLLGLQVQKSVQEWTKNYKVHMEKGQPEVPPHEMASLVAPDGPKASAYLVFHNFRTIMRYNTSPLYSIAVWQLALQIIDGLGSSASQFPELVSALRC